MGALSPSPAVVALGRVLVVLLFPPAAVALVQTGSTFADDDQKCVFLRGENTQLAGIGLTSLMCLLLRTPSSLSAITPFFSQLMTTYSCCSYSGSNLLLLFSFAIRTLCPGVRRVAR